jgi:hypothetical protein
MEAVDRGRFLYVYLQFVWKVLGKAIQKVSWEYPGGLLRFEPHTSGIKARYIALPLGTILEKSLPLTSI